MASKTMKTLYVVKATGHDFNECNKVWLWNPKRRKGLSPKQQTNWKGIFGSTLVYCYRCTHVGFVNSLTSAASWIAYKGAFMQDPPHGKPSTDASAMGS
ncbi:hypothetical protein TNCV_257811 [Trichonephila clavipes]|uniref:Uncharacterized protein n=1 Tax=Trichonephila clavipes TaxID=2585209 RepID=A0A8X6RV81_TRICX|nr:hypothetical protein TNCV_257811 [Trichonephila clavipes]